MTRHFGSLGIKVRGIIWYSLSPHEQRAFAGAISKGVPNMLKRIRSQFLKVVTPMALGYMIYDWGSKENARVSRKDPKEFENDV